MAKFTDEDLKRFKDKTESMTAVDVSPSELFDFIARLEAAEALERYWKHYSPVSAEDEKEYDKKIKAWLEAAGK